MPEDGILTAGISDDAGSGGDQTGNTNAGQGGQGGDVQTSEFLTSLTEELRGHEALKGVADASDLARRYVEASGKIPAVPEKLEDYDVGDYLKAPSDLTEFKDVLTVMDKAELDKLFSAEPERVNQLRQIAKDAGLSKDQFARLLAHDKAEKVAQLKAVPQILAKARESAEAALRQTWGDNYDTNLALAQKVIRAMGDDATVKFLNRSGLASDPTFAVFLAKIGASVSEDVLQRGTGGPPPALRTPGGSLMFPSYANMT